MSSRVAKILCLMGISLWPKPCKLMTLDVFPSWNPLIRVGCNMLWIKCRCIINSRVESYLHSMYTSSPWQVNTSVVVSIFFFNLELHKIFKGCRWLLCLRATLFIFRPYWDIDSPFCTNDSIEQSTWFLPSFICLLLRSLTEVSTWSCSVWDVVGSCLEICLLFVAG